jgi:NHL repeat
MLCALLLLTTLAQPAARADTVRATVTARIAEDSPTPFLFGTVTGLAIDAAGRVYVSDGGESRVAVFTSRASLSIPRARSWGMTMPCMCAT